MGQPQPSIQAHVQAGLSGPSPPPPSLPRVVHDGLDELQVDVTELVEPEVVEDLRVGGREGGREGGKVAHGGLDVLQVDVTELV